MGSGSLVSSRSTPAAANRVPYGSRLGPISLHRIVLDTANFIAVGISFFIVQIGVMLVMVGAMGGIEKKSETAPTHTEVLREIVRVRCKYSNTLDFETSQYCSNCGAHL